jgi:hypothetical protein
MVVLMAQLYFHADNEPLEAVPAIADLIAELTVAKERAGRNELQPGVGGLIDHPLDNASLAGSWWIDATDQMFTKRFQAIEIEGHWHVLDHKHPEFIAPAMSEADAQHCCTIWNSSSHVSSL